MPAHLGLTPTIYPNEEETLNGNGNDGDESGQIIPTVVQPTRVEESKTLVPQQALDTIPVPPHSPSRCLITQAYLYMLPNIIGTWKVQGCMSNKPGGEISNYFDHWLVWLFPPLDKAERGIIMELSGTSCYWEPGGSCSGTPRSACCHTGIVGYESKDQGNHHITNEWAYADKNLHEINQTLTGLTRQMTIVKEITKTWNRMEGELNHSMRIWLRFGNLR